MHRILLAFIKSWGWPLLIALIGWSAVVFTRTDPGITCDEPFSVVYGADFVSRLGDRGWEFFSTESINETFSQRSEHPPFGRWVIGGVHRLVSGRPSPSGIGVQDILDARFAPATAFALMLLLLTRSVMVRSGSVAGISAGFSLLLMPRVFAHAHLAALDTMVSCTYLCAVLSAGWMMERRWPWLAAPIGGLFLGLALLTKMHGVFLPPLIACWAIVCYRFRALLPTTIWIVTGVAVFFAGWPWLWHDLGEIARAWQSGGTVAVPHLFPRLTAYLGSSIDRGTIDVRYFGIDMRDTEVPWHYPWVIAAVAVPIGIQLLALAGVWQQLVRRRQDRRGWLTLAACAFPLIVFSLPRVPVYDGDRLFLMVFPFWAALAGEGAGWAWEWLELRWGNRLATACVSVFLACQAYGLVHYHPFQLSYYNAVVGGLRGAEKLGFEVTYWGDSVTADLLDDWSNLAPEKACAQLVPTMYSEQAELYRTASMLKKQQRLVGRSTRECPYFVVYNRHAYLTNVRSLIDDPNRKPTHENSIDGVWVARIYTRTPPNRDGGQTGARSDP